METSPILKIAILGAESTGKSELCAELAKHYHTVWVPEYAREYFNNSDIYNYNLEDLVAIAKKQIELENQIIKDANKFLFCDTTLITLQIWAELEFNQTTDFIAKKVSEIKYDYYFITDNDLPWVKDEQRQNKFSRDLILELNQEKVKKVNTPFSIIQGLEGDRLKNAIRILENQFKS